MWYRSDCVQRLFGDVFGPTGAETDDGDVREPFRHELNGTTDADSGSQRP
jgi:hypothetical protein